MGFSLHIGEVASKKLANYGYEIFDYDIEKLQGIEGFGKDMAQSFYDFCIHNKDFIHEMQEILKPQLQVKTTQINTDFIFSSKNLRYYRHFWFK